jgi:hypothetical protein
MLFRKEKYILEEERERIVELTKEQVKGIKKEAESMNKVIRKMNRRERLLLTLREEAFWKLYYPPTASPLYCADTPLGKVIRSRKKVFKDDEELLKYYERIIVEMKKAPNSNNNYSSKEHKRLRQED